MKTFFFPIVLIVISKFCFSQPAIHPACDTTFPFEKSLTVYIKGHIGEKQISKEFLQNDFELAVSDTSYKISFLRFSWNDSNTVFQRKNNSNVINVEMPNYNKPDKEIYSLKNIKPGAYLVFECMQVEKNGIVYRVAPFTVRVKEK
jgi:hypothetical protein